jgi:hypothetical protein
MLQEPKRAAGRDSLVNVPPGRGSGLMSRCLGPIHADFLLASVRCDLDPDDCGANSNTPFAPSVSFH